MKAILIDDEIHCTASLQIQLQENCPDIQVMAVCNDALMALQAIQSLKPDLVFLDIEMPRLNGFQLLDALKNQDFAIIFTTAYNEFAVKAFKYAAIDYLLKPIDDEELINAVKKTRNRDQSLQPHLELFEKQFQSPQKPPEKIALAYQDGYVFVNPQEIIYCESDNNYTKFHLINGQILISAKPLKEVDEMLEDLNFFRIHKQYLINLNQIKKYVKNNGPYVVMNNGVDLSIARNRKDDFQNRFLKF